MIHSPFVTGALGAVVTAIKFTPGATWFERAINVACGSLVAGFVTPALIDWLSVESASYSSGAAFLFGLLGMSLAAAILDGIKTTQFGEIIKSWLQRRG